MSRNIVITGAAGALGAAVVEKFKREGYYVIALVRPEANEQAKEIFECFDILANRLGKGLDVFFHEARYC